MRASLGVAGLLLLLTIGGAHAAAAPDDVLQRVNATLTYAEQVKNALVLSWLRESGVLAMYAKAYNLTSLPGMNPTQRAGSGKVHAAGLLGSAPPLPQLPPLPPLLLPKLPPPPFNLSKFNISKPPKLEFPKLQLPKPLPPLFKPGTLPPLVLPPIGKALNSTGLETLKTALLLAWLKETGAYDKLVALNKSTEEMNTLLSIAAKQVDRKFTEAVTSFLMPVAKIPQVVRAASIPSAQVQQPTAAVAGADTSGYATAAAADDGSSGVEGPDADDAAAAVAAPAVYAPTPTFVPAPVPVAAAPNAAGAASSAAASGPCFKLPNGKARQACFNTFVVRMQIATKAVTCAGVPPADAQQCINDYVVSVQRRQAAAAGGGSSSSGGPQTCEDLAVPRRQGCINAWINAQMKIAAARRPSVPRPSVPRPVAASD